MPTTAGRRELTFASYNDIMPEIDRLMERGYTKVGHWSLGQACYHLSRAMRLAVDPGTDLSNIKVPWVLKTLIGPLIAKGRLLKSGKMPEGFKGPAAMEPPADADDRAEVEALRATVRIVSAHPGPFHPHPVLGALNRNEWERLNCVHTAHHLSFLRPNA
jgi:hypothetical protein